MAKNKMLHTIAHVKRAKTNKSDEDKGLISAVIGSTEVLDRVGDVISQDGWDLKNYKKNPVILWGHNVRQDRPPIGQAVKVWLDGAKRGTKKLMFDIQFDLQDTFAAEIYRKVKDGFVNTVSVGFIPLEREDNVFTKNELLELSFVPVPANPEALVTLRSAGLDTVENKEKLYGMVSDEELETIMNKNETEADSEETNKDQEKEKEDIADQENEEKPSDEEESEEKTEENSTETEDSEEETEDNDSKEQENDKKDGKDDADEEDTDKSVDDIETKNTIPYKNLGKAPETEEWDGPGEMAKCENVTQLKRICAWVDASKADSKDSYKLPHHKGGAENNVAVWRGVASAMAALLGAKGGASLPERQRRGVYNHLAKHYQEFGKEAPAFKMVEDQVLAGLDEEIHALILDREDKHVVRLIKQLIKQQKKTQKTVKSKTVVETVKETQNVKSEGNTMSEAIEALKIIDKALTLATKPRDGKE